MFSNRRVMRAASAAAPYAILLGVSVATVQALIWLWSASQYLLSPLMALLLVALGAALGTACGAVVAGPRTTRSERREIDAAVEDAIPESVTSRALVPFKPSSATSRHRMPEPVVVTAVRRVVTERLLILAAILGLASTTVGVITAVTAGTVRRGLPRSGAMSPGALPSSTTPPATSPSSASPLATEPSSTDIATPPGTEQVLGGSDIVLVSEAVCGNAPHWTEVETVVDGRQYERGAYAIGGSCKTSKGYSLATATYVLSKRYSRFRAVVGIADDAPPIQPVRVEMAIDDADVPKERRSIRVGEPWVIDLQSRDVVRVTFRIYLYNGLPQGSIVVVGGGAAVA